MRLAAGAEMGREVVAKGKGCFFMSEVPLNVADGKPHPESGTYRQHQSNLNPQGVWLQELRWGGSWSPKGAVRRAGQGTGFVNPKPPTINPTPSALNPQTPNPKP